MKRRRVLAATASSLGIVLAGCLGDDEDSSDDGSEGDEDEENTGDDTEDEDNEEKSDNGSEEENQDDGGSEQGDAPFGGRVGGTSQGGYLAIGESSESDAEENGFGLPAEVQGEDPITISANVSADGTWESSNVDFKPVSIEEPQEAVIQVDLPDGLSGEIDSDAERMTATGRLVATVLVGGEELGTIEFTIDATTGNSGNLSGAADFESEPASVTLVDNEFEIDESGNPFIDEIVELPTASGENWLQLTFDLSPA